MFNFKKYQEIQGFIRKHQKISKIVAISKNHPKESVIEALKHGVRIFGENRVQEAKIKFVELFKEYPNLELHFTGTLQTNKVKSALQIFQVFQTIDRENGIYMVEDSKFVDDLMFWQGDADSSLIIDPVSEAERLRENAAAGLPATFGESPTIRRK